MSGRPPKLVLAVIDGLKPEMLERAVQTGRAPALEAIIERGRYVAEGAVAAFPSVTPVCAGAIGTGRLQDAHLIASMNWYSRSERRYIEYGSSFSAARRFGIAKQLTDTVFNLNMEHLPADVPTVFERLDDAGVRTAGTTYLIYRGRHRHEVSRDLALTRIAGALWRRHVMGPTELFYADIFASRDTGCRSQLGMPGMRDSHAGCVAAHLVEHDLFDFLLLSLPDNDTHSHRYGPHAQVTSIAAADRQLERMMHAAGGPGPFLDEHAVIVVADHSHAKIERRIDLGDAFADWHVLPPSGRMADAEIALCPAARAAMVYVLVEEARDVTVARLAHAALEVEGVDLAMWLADEQAVIASAAGGELRFAPGDGVRDARDGGWTVEGDLGVLAAESPRRRPHLDRISERTRARLGRADLPDLRRRAAVGGRGLGVRRLGWGRSRRRREPRLVASQRLGRRAGLLRGRAGPRPRRVVDHRHRADDLGPLRGRAVRPAVAIAATLLASGVVAAPAGAAAAPAATGTVLTTPATGTTEVLAGGLIRPTQLNTPPVAHRLTPNQALTIAIRVPKIRRARAKYPGSHGEPFQKGITRWQVSFFAAGKERKEIGQVIIDDATAKVVEAWTGYQVPWTMARGYSGAFGRKVNSPWVWIPLSVLFVLPFVDPRRPFRWLHLDLLVLSAFSVSLALFNNANVDASVPVVYPLLAYLLARMLAVALRRGPVDPVRLLVPVSWIAVAAVFLVGFRIGLNVASSNVIDVGYAGVIGADRLSHGESLYGHFPMDNDHGDTYGPVVYEAYVPFEQALPWHGRWDDLPAAHAAAVFFDLLCAALLFLLGRRVRGPTLGIVLAYAWVSYPFTLFASNSNTNDALVAALVLAAVLAASRPVLRGAAAVLAGLTKFAPLALAPVLATHDLERGRRFPQLARFALGFIVVGALAMLPVFLHESLSDLYERTVDFQASRGSPFSVWGLYDWTSGQHVVQALAVVLAVVLALVPRRRDIAGLAAACAAVLIALQLGVTHWFYLYLPWFVGLVMLALLGRAPLAPHPGRAHATGGGGSG